ncbi:unnamed protein product [Candidula unifasciata]|uniref:Carboxylic ester hydrolase n=1 Tax=Candidula unifasciata TaxID=100452 RepID=A0A8S3Z3Y4_9EUPU|nr:unnamed protein product [Candidula unifasciata]
MANRIAPHLVCLTLACLLAAAWAADTSNNTVEVSLNPGQQLRGFYRALATGTVIYKFWGIRYGQPPTGDKRFSQPEAAPEWQGVRDALDFGPRCWQSPVGKGESEDCLFLNVFTPTLNGSIPVMVWIHGGAYNTGSGSDFRYDGSTLADRGVVIVTINYRLGAYGFLSTEDDVMPGNYGLLDQVLALKWVQKNIHAFGGDPNKVTIFGESAGSSSVSLHVLSPLSKGLFHRAIMQSGCSLSVWAVERPASEISVEQYTRQVGARVGCSDDDSEKFLTCLRKVDAQELFNASYVFKHEVDIDIIAPPRVETKFGFLPHYPQYILDNGLFNKVDTIRGFNSGEWSFVINDADEDGLTRREFAKNFANAFSSYSLNNKTKKHLLQIVKSVYLGNETNPIAIRSSLIEAFRDTLFAASELLELEKMLSHGGEGFNHYVYELAYRVQSLLELQSLGPEWWGVIHSGDLPLVFTDDQVGLVASMTSPEDLAVGNKIQTWWTNFAKFGNPTATKVDEDGVDVRWDQYTLNSPQVLTIDLKSTLAPYSRQSALQLFDDILTFLKSPNATSATSG